MPLRAARMASKAFGTGPKYVRGLKTSPAYSGEGRRMGRMESEGGFHFECQGLLPPPSLIRVKATALLSVA
jgi:hypothetical protein